ncbi:MAG: hypothetical protein ACHQTE_01520 [Candidatus Saccharimonadales bacterium]
MSDLLVQQNQLQNEAKALLEHTRILEFLSKLGDPIQTGSSMTGLMVYPDIDFSIQNDDYNIQDAIALTNSLFKHLKVTAFKIANFSQTEGEDAGYYFGFELPYRDKTWHIDATVSKVSPIVTNPPELQGWIENMNADDRMIILDLKKQLIDAKRYVGARSQPPHTFRSAHLYEGVLKGGAKSLTALENYYKSKLV